MCVISLEGNNLSQNHSEFTYIQRNVLGKYEWNGENLPTVSRIQCVHWICLQLDAFGTQTHVCRYRDENYLTNICTVFHL